MIEKSNTVIKTPGKISYTSESPRIMSEKKV